ncbi:MAG: hypothetical protein L6R40_006864 [Gallowayella cf. fulva]|nr:MAG: hypothetical protein L6R40_006864 [Xanthomendoza cf. fulva]
MRFPAIATALALFNLAQSQLGQSQLTNYGGFTPKSPVDAMTIGAIHNVLALFNYALDTKNFGALRDVYTTDVIAKVARVRTNDLESLIKFYNGTALGDVVTQHTAHTIFVYAITPTTAKSISYANALYFSPIEEGKLFARAVDTFYERYADTWAKQKYGQWQIKERSIDIYAQVGNSSLVPPTQPTFNTTKV